MSPGLSDEELDRIREFASTPRHERTPEMLVGADEEEEE